MGFNGKVKCISTEGSFTVGRAYDVVDGIITFDTGDKCREKFNDINQMNTFFLSQFVNATDFTKSELKDGMVLVSRNGKKYIWLNGKARGMSDSCSINEDLTTIYANAGYDIVKVYEYPDDCLNIVFEYISGRGKLIWERPSVVEMTMAEVCKALGKTIKIVEG